MPPKFIIGYTDKETVKLDLDCMPLKLVKNWASKAMKQFKLGGFIILKSSEMSYHVVFDRSVSWSKNVGIVAWVCLMSKHRRLTEWLVMQCIKGASTLRVSAKKRKPSPRIVYRYGKQDKQIRCFLRYRRFIKSISNKLCQKIGR